MQLFRPIQPMLAQTAEDTAEAIPDLGEAALEYKLDGARVQVHRSGDEVRVYSRQLNDVTAAVPEIVEAVRAMPGKELILDGEVLSLEAGRTSRAVSGHDAPVRTQAGCGAPAGRAADAPFWFDLLYLNGGSLLDETQSRRFATLANSGGRSAPSSRTRWLTTMRRPPRFFAAHSNVGTKGSWRNRRSRRISRGRAAAAG